MSFGPPKDGRPYMPAPKRLHRLAERFPRQIDEARRDRHRDALAAKLHAHVSSPHAGMSWLDALLYERLFSDRVVPFPPVVSSSSSSDCVDPEGYWCPSVATLERLVELMDSQEELRQRCMAAVVRRNQVLETILQTTCFAARQHELREREYKRAVVSGLQSSSSSDTFLSRLQQGDDGSFSSKTSPVTSPLRGRGGAGVSQPLTLMQLWPNDVTRQFLQRVTVTGFNACVLPKPHVACCIASHKRLAELVEELDGATDDVVSGVMMWRMHLNRPLPFVVGGHNVMLMIQNELETLVTSITSHLTEHAGGQTSYNAKDCGFHYISRYAGGTGAGGGGGGGGGGTSLESSRRGVAISPMDSSRRHHLSVMQMHVAKTLGYTVSRELTVQMKLVEDGARLAQERGMHIPPLHNYVMPSVMITPSQPQAGAMTSTSAMLKSNQQKAAAGTKQHQNASQLQQRTTALPPMKDHQHGSNSQQQQQQRRTSGVELPSFVLEARGDPSAIRKHVVRQGRPIVSLPIIVQAPKKWFDAKHSARLGDDDEDDDHISGIQKLSLIDEMRKDLEMARALALNANGGASLDSSNGVSMSISMEASTSRGGLLAASGMSPSNAAAAAAAALMGGRSFSAFVGNGSLLLPPISPLAGSGASSSSPHHYHQDVAAATVRRCIPAFVEDSAFLPVVVVDHAGYVTNGGLHYLLHREVDREGPVVLQRTRQWLRECYTQGRMILEEPFGSVVEPHMQQLAFEQSEAAALVAEEEQQALRDGRPPRPVRELLRHRRNRSVVPVEDYGNDEKLDKLVLVAYQGGAAVRTPPPGASKNKTSQNQSLSSPPSSPLGGDGGALDVQPPAIIEDEEALKRLVTLQRRSVKRFGLRMLRVWLRFHMHQVHRNEITTDLLEKNTGEWLRRRFVTWLKLTTRRRSARQRTEVFKVAMEQRLLRRRFATWKIVLLSRAVAKNFNQWLYRDAYFRWLYLVLEKRINACVKVEEAKNKSPSGGGRPWLSAMAQIGKLVGRRLTTEASPMTLLASLPPPPLPPPTQQSPLAEHSSNDPQVEEEN
ncbi:Hypothetical protein, putative [Bodo saltans]|uniref:Uncharacterized protein n=1 Tax=Bodo saltans TaxID=75058 RepID=A0A0S4JB26_BODSA|nr:Hypothetical protein, putative [Bodo saltans]|eukprot:CUG86181.1 Hypothetical protein, putative [Bodo saltans]